MLGTFDLTNCFNLVTVISTFDTASCFVFFWGGRILLPAVPFLVHGKNFRSSNSLRHSCGKSSRIGIFANGKIFIWNFLLLPDANRITSGDCIHYVSVCV